MLSVKISLKRVCLWVALAAAATATQAAVKLPAIFSDRMVLQRADKVPVWGWANPGEEVSVTLEDVKGRTKANAEGKWMLELNLAKLGQGPYKMTVRGENEIVIDDVAIGQVWLASGQSNMGWVLRNTIGGDKEIAAGAGNFIRQFRVRYVTAEAPAQDLKGSWMTAQPGEAGSFSAVAYFFAKKLNQELKEPVGIINSSWGGTPSEAWTSAAALDSDKDLAEARKRRNAVLAAFPARKADFAGKLGDWIGQHALEDGSFAAAADFAGEGVDTTGWTSVDFSGKITGKGLPQQGVLWIRRDVTIPKSAAGKDMNYQIQEGRGYFTFYWNGTRFAGPEKWTTAEIAKLKGKGMTMNLKIPGKLVKEGKNVLSIRIYSPAETPGRIGGRNTLRGGGNFEQGMGGKWLAKAEKVFDVDATALAAVPRAPDTPAELQRQPARLYNAMIAPLAPYRLAGVIWYQGESNAGRAWQYRTAFPLLIQDWRKLWNEPNLPFYFCQLANYMSKSTNTGESAWAELREAQSYTLKLPHTGQAVLIDLGEAEDIHPRNKEDVGERLALLALANDYNRKDVVAVGPTYEDKAVVGNKVYLKFRDEGKGSELVAHTLPATYPLKTANNTSKPLVLPSPDSQLQGFMICGADKKWVWAQAKVEGKHSVVVWSPQVPEPIAVRYAWANNPTCNLYNASGLPAVPFRTDDFPASTLKERF